MYGDGNCLFRAVACKQNKRPLSCTRNEDRYPPNAQYSKAPHLRNRFYSFGLKGFL